MLESYTEQENSFHTITDVESIFSGVPNCRSWQTRGWLYSRRESSRVDDMEGNVHEIWYEQQVALWTSSATLGTEGLLIGKTEQQESDVVGQVMEGLIIESNTLLKVAIVSVRESKNSKSLARLNPDPQSQLTEGLGMRLGSSWKH